MKILAIDTTSRIINIALSTNGKIFCINKDIQSNDYESSISLIKSILKKAKLKISQIDYFGVCVGPGSFTGIRIGLSTIKALAYSKDKPIIGFKSLDILAEMLKDKFSGLLCIMQDARRNNIYSAVFGNNGLLQRVSQYFLCDIPQLLNKVKKINKKNHKIYFYGDAVIHYKDDIKKFFPHSILLYQKDHSLKAQAMISIIINNLKMKSNPLQLFPFYIYPKDCQVRIPIK